MNKIVVLGGTGTLGSAFLKELLKDPGNEVVCFSRDEHKQKKTKEAFQGFKNLSFALGDIRDLSSLHVLKNAQAVFHCAALKHIDILEDFPEECLKTNILGSLNVAQSCLQFEVPYVMFSSTDKAVFPINAYGFSKALSERIFLNFNLKSKTQFTVYRWGNIIGSNGSVIPDFISKLKKGEVIPITDAKMTRFWLKIEDAVGFVLSTYQNKNEKVLIPSMRSAHVTSIVSALGEILGVKPEIKYVGLRKGEKLDECLCSQDQIYSNDPHYLMGHEELVSLLKPLVKS